MGHPALIVIDVQKAIDDPKWGPRNNPEAEQVIARLLAAWRSAGAAIWHVRHDSAEPGSPYRPDLPSNAFKDEAAPLPDEPVIAKRTNSAFIGTDLEARLRAAGHRRLVMCGTLTHNSFEATVRNAGNLGFETYVVSDACWSVDKTDLRGKTFPAEDVHHLSLAHMHGEFAEVIDSTAALALLEKG